MFDKPNQKPPEKRAYSPGLRLTIIGFLIIWGASIAFALQLKTISTAGKNQVDYDPSFDYTVAALCFILVLLGIVFLWRGLREMEGLPGGRFSKSLTIAAAINMGLILFVLVVAGLIYSANRAFITQNQPLVRDEPAPDYSMPAFPTPALLQPTPTFDPSAAYLSGPILSYFSGLRVGSMWISASKSDNTINFMQVDFNRIECHIEEGNTVSTYAIDKSQLVIRGPIQKEQDNSFYAAQNAGVVQGIMGSTASAYGTVSVHYVDPATNRSCDLGTFTWTAAATGP
jgi:hypothetical protein